MAFASVDFWTIDQVDVGAAEVFVHSGFWYELTNLVIG
jgi:hypothetical protein